MAYLTPNWEVSEDFLEEVIPEGSWIKHEINQVMVSGRRELHKQC